MDVLLGIAVLVVAVATVFMTVRFRSAIRASAERLDQVTARLRQQVAEQGESTDRQIEARREKDRRNWSRAFEALRVQTEELDTRISREMAQLRAALGEQDRKASQIETDLENQVNQLKETIQAPHAQLRSEVRQLSEAIERLRQVVQVCTTAASDELTEVKRLLSDAQRELGEQFRRAESAALKNARNISYMHRHLSGIQEYIRQRFNQETSEMGDSVHPLMIGGVFSTGAAATDILPILYDNFCGALKLQIMLREVESVTSTRFYLRGELLGEAPPEEYLEGLLKDCSVGNPEASAAGLNELRSLVVAIFSAEAAAFRVGPMVVSCSHGNLLGAALNTAEQADVHGQQAVLSPEGYETILRGLGPGRVVELTSWAARCGSV